METKEIDVNKLSKLYPQLDELTSDEKWKAIDYLVKSLSADNNNTTNIETNNEKTNTELLATISNPQVSENKKAEIKEVNEHIEKLIAKDLTVYIHWCPKWQYIFWESQDSRNDPLLVKSHFNKYYSNLGDNVVLVKDLWDWSTEYTIKRPSREMKTRGSGDRIWGYLWLTFILRNWYKVKGTSLPDKNYRQYPLDTDVGDFMDSFMNYLITDCDFVNSEPGRPIQRKYSDDNAVRRVIFKVKNAFINAMNEIESNKGLIVKDNS